MNLDELTKYTVSKYGETLAPSGYVYSSDEVEELVAKMEARINELEFAYESHVNDMYLLETRIKELEAENEQLKQELNNL